MLRTFIKIIPRVNVRMSMQSPKNFTWNRQCLLHTKVLDSEIRARSQNAQEPFSKELKENEPLPNADVFGDLEGKAQEPVFEEDSKDEEEQVFRPKSRKLPLYDYARLIKEHLNNKQVKEAIDILEVRMKEDRVKPTSYIFNLLISGCAKAGYSKKAFQLYNKMKQRDLPVKGGTYTSLFNACANSPWLQDGLSKANRLREIMAEKGYEINEMNYNAMIKAFGRCGDIKTAFQLADEMIEKKLSMKTDTFNFLLQACASEQDYGFRHALLTWHKMRKNHIVPDKFSFSIMLRCVRDCSIGDLETMEEVIATILTKPKILLESGQNLKIAATSENSNLPSTNITEISDTTPNLLQENPHLGSLIEISEIKTPQDRLLLLGGFSGYMAEMKKVNVTPGIEIFTALLEVIPPTTAAEKQLLFMVKKIGLKSDIDFFNILMKKRSMRFDYEGAREVLDMIRVAKLQPDIVTYGILSLSCRTQEEARELLSEMRNKGIRMNMAILGAMLRQGCANRSFSYVHEIMQISLDENIRPNEAFLRHLDNFIKQCSNMIEKKHPATKPKSFKPNLENFQKKLKIWYKEHDLEGLKLEDAIKKIKGNPYEQFKTPKEKGFELQKNEKLLKKQKVRKYIKKIKLKDMGEPDSNKSITDGKNVVI